MTSHEHQSLADAAQQLLGAGLCVLPAHLKAKCPALGKWTHYQKRLPTAKEAESMFRSPEAICIVTGTVSGNLELLDFDVAAEKFEQWAKIVRERLPGVLEKCFIERSQSGGKHVVFRCQEPVEGSMKLAMRVVDCHSNEEHEYLGKHYKPRKKPDGSGYEFEPTLIETKGERGLFLCAPSPGYVAEQGDLTNLPVLSPEEHATFIAAAIELNEKVLVATETSAAWTHPQSGVGKKNATPSRAKPADGSLRSGDDFTQRGDIREVLKKHGWKLWKPGDNEHWTRPGKPGGTSATLKDGVFYVFTTSVSPFEPNKGYSIFQTYALLEHGGDWKAAARQLASEGYGTPFTHNSEVFMESNTISVEDDGEDVQPESSVADPGPFPENLLQVPGFIGEVMAYNKATAHRWQPVLALGGAIALQAVLAARKVQDERGNRTNVYIINLAGSGGGKENARAVNKKILLASNCQMLEGAEDLASDAGLVAEVAKSPAVLLQIDEFGRWLRTIADPRHNPHQFAIVSALLKLYSCAGTMFRGKAYADSSRNQIIEQPCVSLLATTAPEHFRQSLSPESVTDGFLARLMVFEAGKLPKRDWAKNIPVPTRLLEYVESWKKLQPNAWYPPFVPEPIVIVANPDAQRVFNDFATAIDTHLANDREDQRAIWARAEEKACRLALVYSCSRNPSDPIIDLAAARWACELSTYLTKRMLWLIHEHVAHGEFDAKQKDVMRFVRTNGGTMSQTEFCRITQYMGTRERSDLMDNLLATGQLKEAKVSTKGRPRTDYKIP